MTDVTHPTGSVSGERAWPRHVAVGALLVLVVGLMAWAVVKLLNTGPAGPKRQVARIALLPDTPPPPPPPPPEKPKVEPKTEMKQQLPDKQKVETPPAPEPLKMEGQAGEGPSPFAAGEVKNDYIGGDIGNGGGGLFAAYVGRVAELLQDELARRKLHISTARVLLWLTPDGAVERYEISGVSGDVEHGIRTAMAGMGRFPEVPPQGMPMPMGLEISQR